MVFVRPPTVFLGTSFSPKLSHDDFGYYSDDPLTNLKALNSAEVVIKTRARYVLFFHCLRIKRKLSVCAKRTIVRFFQLSKATDVNRREQDRRGRLPPPIPLILLINQSAL